MKPRLFSVSAALPWLLLVCLCSHPFHLAVAAPVSSLTLVSSSPATQRSDTAGGDSFQPALSRNGQFVAFVSLAPNLLNSSPGIATLNVYLRDRVSGEVWLVSAGTNSLGGNAPSVGPVVSADGRYVAFESSASNLAPGDTNETSDVFLYDRQTGSSVLASRTLDGWTAFRRASTTPLLSADGRHLVFESYAPNLVANDTNNAADIFVFDRDTAQSALVSINAEGNGSRSGENTRPTMTPDGRWVAYVNRVTNSLTAQGIGHIYVRQLPDGPTHWVSSNAAVELTAYRGAVAPVLSAQGGFVYFYAYNTTTTNLYRSDLASGQNRLVRSGVQARSTPTTSADGRFVAYESGNLLRVVDVTNDQETYAGPSSTRESSRPILSEDGLTLTFLSAAGDLTSNPTNGYTQVYQRHHPSGIIELLSGDRDGRGSGDLSAVVFSVSPSGDLVAFESVSTTMVTDDFNMASDVFVRNVPSKTTELISKRYADRPSSSTARATLYPNSFSVDGRFLAYASLDRDESAGDTNGVYDIFVRDLQTDEIEAISVSDTGAYTNRLNSRACSLSADGRYLTWMTLLPGTGDTGYPTIYWCDRLLKETRSLNIFVPGRAFPRVSPPALSPDGRWVAFETGVSTSSFEAGVFDNNYGTDIVLYDAVGRTNFIVSRSILGWQSGNGGSFAPQFSPDGRWIAFGSTATDLTGQPSMLESKLFVRDLVNQITIEVSSRPYEGEVGLSPIYLDGAVFSGDSQWIAYNAFGGYVGLYHLPSGILSNVCVRCANPTLSFDGRFLAVAAQNQIAGGTRVLLLDRATGRASVLGTNVARGAMLDNRDATSRPLFSQDGRYLVFRADRPLESPLASPALYVRDVLRGFTVPLSVNSQGTFGNDGSYFPQFAPDSRTVAFLSLASDLVSNDFNGRADVFTVRIGSPDGDQDGLDDDWEVAHFGNLTRDGADDFDQDGHSDRTEFQTGTDPTNLSSVLSMFAVTLPDSVVISWNSVPGRTYDVEFKPTLNDAWTKLFEGVAATATTRAVTIINSEPRQPRGFYRVAFAP